MPKRKKSVDSRPRGRPSPILRISIAFSIIAASHSAPGSDTPTVQLAAIYRKEIDVRAFLVSEKLDGVRAIWKDGALRTRSGERIHAPKWFTDPLPEVWLDGELWSERQDFEKIASTVRKTIPVEEEWRRIRFMVFDAPDSTRPFRERAAFYTRLIKELNLPHVKPVRQFSVARHADLMALFERYTEAGAEGLMLHRADARFKGGRSDDLLKLKPYMDDEAVVTGYSPGKGRLAGKMGAVIVRWINGSGESVEFKIGTGFSDCERAHPPRIGQTITFKYHGVTRLGIPRFASCLKRCGARTVNPTSNRRTARTSSAPASPAR